METMAQTLEHLYQQKSRIRLCLVIWAVIAAGCAVGAFLLHLVVPSLLVLLADMAFYFIVIHRMTKNYGFAINRANLLHGFLKPLKNASYQVKDGMTRERFVDMQFLPVKIGENTLMSRNDFAGDAWELHVEGHELTFHYVIMNKKQRSELQFVSGALFIGSGTRPTTEGSESGERKAGDLLLIRNDLLDRAARDQFLDKNGYQPAVISSPSLRKDFGAYSHREGVEFPEELAESILKLGAKAKNFAALRIREGETAVFLTRRFYAGSRYTTTDPTEEILSKNYFPERDDIFTFLRFCRTYM